MKLCEIMRGWRWQGSAGTFRAGVGVLMLGISLAQSVPPQNVCPAAAAPHSLTQPQYQDTADNDTSAGFMAALVQSFLHTVQPTSIPESLVLKITQEVRQSTFSQDLIKEILLYKVGFLVCVAIGVLYIVLMPIVGFFLACCRCCGNCGGKMYQKQTSSIHCRRRTLYWSAFVTTIIILAGNICMFKSNDALTISVKHSPMELNKSINNIHTFLTAVPQQVDHVVNESYTTIQKVTGNLNDIGHLLGAQVLKVFGGTLNPALNSIRLLDQETVNASVILNKLNSSLAQLQSSMDSLKTNFTAVKNRINQTLSNPNCNGCGNVILQNLTLDISITIPHLQEFQVAVNEVNNTNLQSKITEVETYFNSIPQRVTNDTMDVVQSSQKVLSDIKTQISQAISDIPLSSLTNLSGTLNQVQREIDTVAPKVESGEYIRWAVCVALCCVVLLVVVCNLMGLVLGPMGLSPKADPTKRSCTADCGGTFLMMGAGFSFLFSWLLMLVVLVLFLLGGNVYTLICQPWKNGQLLKFIDTPGLIPELEKVGPTLGLKTDINISDIYRDCKDNQPLWTTLHLYELINLDNLLNVSKYTVQIQQNFENTNITLSTIILLSPEFKKQLNNFSTEAKNASSTSITQQMMNISGINLTITADTLDKLADTQTNNDTKKELRDEATELRMIQSNIKTIIIPQLENLNLTIEDFRSIAEKIHGTVGEVLSNVGVAQDLLNTNATQIFKTESRKFLDCQLGYFVAYADYANLTITQQVGRCGPVAGAVDTVEIILCSHIVESLNAFWFSLGWCMIFFIPSIIFSVKLAKYYRKMKTSDVYDNLIIMNHIPRAQLKST